MYDYIEETFEEIERVLEGEQADAYRARKEKEKEASRKDDVKAIYRTSGSGFETAHNYNKAREKEGRPELSDAEFSKFSGHATSATSYNSKINKEIQKRRSEGKATTQVDASHMKSSIKSKDSFVP